MTDSDFKKAIAEALLPEYEAMIPEHDEHVFSEKFEKKMRKLIRRRKKPYYMMINTGFKRAACIIIAFLVISFTTVMSVDALRKPFLDFITRIFSDHTSIETILALDKTYPDRIEEKYEISLGLDDYSLQNRNINDCMIVSYYLNTLNSKTYIIFNQMTIDQFKLNLNTQDSEIESVELKSAEAVFYSGKSGDNNLIWNNGRYIICLSSNVSKDILIRLADSVQKVE